MTQEQQMNRNAVGWQKTWQFLDLYFTYRIADFDLYSPQSGFIGPCGTGLVNRRWDNKFLLCETVKKFSCCCCDGPGYTKLEIRLSRKDGKSVWHVLCKNFFFWSYSWLRSLMALQNVRGHSKLTVSSLFWHFLLPTSTTPKHLTDTVLWHIWLHKIGYIIDVKPVYPPAAV